MSSAPPPPLSGGAPPPPGGPGPGAGAARARVVRTLASLATGQFLPEHARLITELEKPQLVSLTDDDRKKATKPFWFAYFWEEARVSAEQLRSQGTLLAQFFEHMYQLPLTWDPGRPECELELRGSELRYKTPSPTHVGALRLKNSNGWDTLPDQMLLTMLEKLLEIGFDSVNPVGSSKKPFNKKDLHTDVDIRRQSLTGELDKAYMLGWRGDGRKVSQISAASGLINKAESDFEGYAASQNMRKPWHPFSKTEHSSKWLFRKAKSDNCLYTVVSVSTDFKTASTFPLLNSDYIVLPPKAPTADEAKDLDAADQRKWYRITGVAQGGQKTVIRFADRQQLYLVIVSTEYFDTQNKQTDKFPEIAVKQIPETGIFACVSFVRVHHVTTDSGGMTALLDRSRTVPPSLDACRRYCQSQKFAKQLYNHVKKLYDDTIQALEKTYAVKWTPTGGEKVPDFADDQGNPMKIQSVKGWFGETLWP
jgi:hypothetical protein